MIKIKRIFLSAASTILFLSSCATRHENPPSENIGSEDNNSGADTVTGSQDLADLSQASEVPEELEPGDTFGDGFCADDIFANYLRQQYKDGGTSVRRKVKSSQTRRANEIFYARKIINGPLNPYFGAIPVVANEHVEQWINYFKNEGRPTFIKWLVRAETFRDIVAPVLQNEGLPAELFYLAMIESGFSNSAASVKKATGTWQFMKGTALIYDLRIDYWVDERRDPIKSTIAAAKYLRDLYGLFGDWYLAMAAYNAGPGKVKRAIRETGTRDFWQLVDTRFLRPETKQYVPKLLAALNLSQNAKAHGFDVRNDEQHLLPKTSLALNRPIALSELAKNLHIPVSELRSWNPEINHDITPPTRGKTYSLRLFPEHMEKFADVEKNLSKIEVTDVLMHAVRGGDTLGGIARRYNVTIKKIRDLNPELNPKSMRIGRQIAVPVPGIISKSPA